MPPPMLILRSFGTLKWLYDTPSPNVNLSLPPPKLSRKSCVTPLTYLPVELPLMVVPLRPVT